MNNLSNLLQKTWRPVLAYAFIAICLFDYIIGPIFWTVMQAFHHGAVQTQWKPMTLEGNGMFFIAMGSFLSIYAHGRTQEKLKGVELPQMPSLSDTSNKTN